MHLPLAIRYHVTLQESEKLDGLQDQLEDLPAPLVVSAESLCKQQQHVPAELLLKHARTCSSGCSGSATSPLIIWFCVFDVCRLISMGMATWRLSWQPTTTNCRCTAPYTQQLYVPPVLQQQHPCKALQSPLNITTITSQRPRGLHCWQ
jgi:hypothetical protein